MTTIILAIVIWLTAFPACAGFTLKYFIDRQTDPVRMEALQPDKVVAYSGVRPGMSILDIGAGCGVFTFRYATALAGTGAVYASDINPVLIKYLGDEAKSRGLKNVIPLLVGPKGLDPAYAKYSYDLIILSDIYDRLLDPVSYFTQLRQLLNEGGRIIIIKTTPDEYFFPGTMTPYDVNNAFVAFSAVQARHPVFKRFRDKTRQYVLHPGYGLTAEEFHELFSDDLNAMLPDPALFGELAAYYKEPGDDNLIYAIGRMGTGQAEYVKWLFGALDEAGVFARKPADLSARERSWLVNLNGICIRGILKMKRPFTLTLDYYHAGDAGVDRVMARAGFAPVNKESPLKYFQFLEFVRK
ncbi:MAG: methyltransferase domain-containing protein [Candidatus Omnitrophota bacterium]